MHILYSNRLKVLSHSIHFLYSMVAASEWHNSQMNLAVRYHQIYIYLYIFKEEEQQNIKEKNKSLKKENNRFHNLGIPSSNQETVSPSFFSRPVISSRLSYSTILVLFVLCYTRSPRSFHFYFNVIRSNIILLFIILILVCFFLVFSSLSVLRPSMQSRVWWKRHIQRMNENDKNILRMCVGMALTWRNGTSNRTTHHFFFLPFLFFSFRFISFVYSITIDNAKCLLTSKMMLEADVEKAPKRDKH